MPKWSKHDGRAPESLTIDPISGDEAVAVFSNPPTATDWITIRPILKQFYVVEKQPLKAVRSVLQHQYGFKAS